VRMHYVSKFEFLEFSSASCRTYAYLWKADVIVIYLVWITVRELLNLIPAQQTNSSSRLFSGW